MCLFNCESCLAPKDIAFNVEPFWIQLHDLPFAGINRTMGERLHVGVGPILLVDVDSSGISGLVLLESQNPLCVVDLLVWVRNIIGFLSNMKGYYILFSLWGNQT